MRPTLPTVLVHDATQRRVGVLAVALLDEPARDGARERLGRPVAADVDAGAQPAGTADLAADRDLPAGLDLAREGPHRPRLLAPRQLAQPCLERVQRPVERRMPLLLGA